MDEKKAYEILKKYNIDYKKFNHKVLTTLEGNLNLVEGQQVKNLVLKNKKERQVYFIIIEESKYLDIGKLESEIGEKRLSFLSEDKLFEYLACHVSAVTPLGLVYDVNNKVKVLIDDSLDLDTTLGVHPFVNNITLNIKFRDLLRIFDDINTEYELVNI
ncbi:YbaK/EbsC family protein [Peptoniphilus stercorisuis]|uniref:Ala-tRNA(Pro) deacylase n=1 Tax=Peptoniphilus stercorisuis TaxID=1436965 RepID=A0ABS4KEN0_9FIRM|nr:YbaK/EbsC family protein [Peptoniphilus stercorisuis]MBP2025731.1 Ala-tRNA(Pro) deacylase [Peptoniphilus stercorisuis]